MPLLLVIAAVVPAPGALAAPASRTLTVRGAANAYADVTFTAPVRLETAASTKTSPRYETSATYAGVYVEAVGGAGPVAGTMLLRAMPSLSDVPFPLGPGGWLRPGKYRVHLLGDAPTTVRIRTSGLRRDLTVVTTARSEIVAKWATRGVAGFATPVDRTIVPFTVGRRTLTVVAEAQESTGFYGRRDICVRKRTNGLSPCLEGDAGHGSYWGVYPFAWTMANAAAYHPGALPTGELEAEFLDATVAATHGFTTFVLTLN